MFTAPTKPRKQTLELICHIRAVLEAFHPLGCRAIYYRLPARPASSEPTAVFCAVRETTIRDLPLLCPFTPGARAERQHPPANVVLGEHRDRLPTEISEPMVPDSIMDTEAKRHAYEAMRVAVTCETCGKLRRGRTWVKADVPNGYVEFLGECPACKSKGG